MARVIKVMSVHVSPAHEASAQLARWNRRCHGL